MPMDQDLRKRTMVVTKTSRKVLNVTMMVGQSVLYSVKVQG